MEDKNRVMNKIVGNLEKIIIGKREVIEQIVIALACEGHVLLEDVPGVGKTTLVSGVAKSISATYKRIQFTPDVMPSDITGFSMFNPKKQEFEFVPGALMSQIILADEINRTPPKTQSSLLEAMEEGQVTVDGKTYDLPKPFFVFATQNPIEYLGTYPLPEAQMDRFIMKLSIGYPNKEQEEKILISHEVELPLNQVQAVVSMEEVEEVQQAVKEIYMDRRIKSYVVSLIDETRYNQDILLGSSPRGSIFLMMASKARALYEGRNYVIPDDVKKMFIPIISHRITLKQETKLKKITTQKVLEGIKNKVQVPTGVFDEKK